MKKGTVRVLAGMAFGYLLALTLSNSSLAKDPAGLTAGEAPRISIQQVKALLGKPDAIIIDVRKSGPLKAGEPKISGAFVEDARQAQSWMGKYPKEKMIILYCA
ncbi:MAG: hypothetical protein FJ118_15295 [Deltaproteobacteria bacterium]|nr:hypothetical protein [Deltaproteobacteria bacterium]